MSDMDNMMRAYVLQGPSDTTLDSVTLAEVPVPEPGPGQVLIKVHAVGLNPVDYKLVASHPDVWTYPHTLGLDVAGEIVTLGDGVDANWEKGMRVAGHGDLRFDGSFAQYAVEPNYALALIPENVSYDVAAGVLCSAMTAYQAINRKPNLNLVRTALVHGGSGAVGGIAVQLAKKHGIKVFTTCSGAKVEEVRKLRPDAIIDYRTEDVTERVKELTGGLGVDLVVDTVGAEEATRDVERLAYNGQLVAIVGGPEVGPGELAARGLSVETVNLGGAHASGNPVEQRDLGTIASDILEMVSLGRLDPLVTTILPFDRLVEGLTELKDHRLAGKAVVTVE
ncbi:MAG: zinc-binding dehydrogenase [Bifidobacterium sp.]|nr:zinc-binding dehydrogenase [Bifidobacterium sp.]